MIFFLYADERCHAAQGGSTSSNVDTTGSDKNIDPAFQDIPPVQLMCIRDQNFGAPHDQPVSSISPTCISALSGSSSVELTEFLPYEMKQPQPILFPQVWRVTTHKRSHDMQFHYKYQINEEKQELRLRMGDLEQNDIFDIFVPRENAAKSPSSKNSLDFGSSMLRRPLKTIENDVLFMFLKTILMDWCFSHSDAYEDSLYYFLRSYQTLLHTCQQWSLHREGIEYERETINNSVCSTFRYIMQHLNNTPKVALAACALIGSMENRSTVTKQDVIQLMHVLKSKEALSFALKEEVSSSIRHIEWISKGVLHLLQHPELSASDRYRWLGCSHLLKSLGVDFSFEEPHISVQSCASHGSEEDSSSGTHSRLNRQFSVAVDELCSDGALSNQSSKRASKIRHVLEALIRYAPSYESLTYMLTRNENQKMMSSQQCLSTMKEKLEMLDNSQTSFSTEEYSNLFQMLNVCKPLRSSEDVLCLLLKSNIFKKASPTTALRLFPLIDDANKHSRMATLFNFSALREWINSLLNRMDVDFRECLQHMDTILQFKFMHEHRASLIEDIISSQHLMQNHSDTARLNLYVQHFQPRFCEYLRTELFVKRSYYIIRRAERNIQKLAEYFDSVCSGRGDKIFSEELLWKIYFYSHNSVTESSIIGNDLWCSIFSHGSTILHPNFQEVYREGVNLVKRLCRKILRNEVSFHTLRLILDHKESFEKAVGAVDPANLKTVSSRLKTLKVCLSQTQQQLSHYHVVMTNFCSHFNVRFPEEEGMKQVLGRVFDSPEKVPFEEAQEILNAFSRVIDAFDARWLFQLRSSEVFLSIWKDSADSLHRSQEGMLVTSQLEPLIEDVKRSWHQIFNTFDGKQIFKSQIEPLFADLSTEKYPIELEKMYLYRSPSFAEETANPAERGDWIHERTLLLTHLKKRRSYAQVVKHLLNMLERLSSKFTTLEHDTGYRKIKTLNKSNSHIYDKDFPLQVAASFEDSPFYSLTENQMEFVEALMSQNQLLRWLINHSSDTDFDNLITICKQFDDDAKVREALESLSIVRSVFHNVLYAESFAGTQELEEKIMAVDITRRHIQDLKSLSHDFPVLLRVFRERTISPGIQSIHLLRALMKFGKYRVGNDIFCINDHTGEYHRWDMESLLDLRSKLMLAEIPQEIQETEAHINLFVRQIPLLIDLRTLHRYLHDQGLFEFSEPQFYREYPANIQLNVLTEHVQELTNLKNRWKKVIRDARDTIYTLNFFTMRQLATMSELLLQAHETLNTDPHESAAILDVSQLLGLLKFVDTSLTPQKLSSVIRSRWFSQDQWDALSSEQKLDMLGRFLESLYDMSSANVSANTPERRQRRRSQSMHTNYRSWASDNNRDMRALSKELLQEPYDNVQFWEKVKSYHFSIVSKDTYREVLDSIISIYATEKRLPSPDEVFICDEHTSIEDLILVINRWYYSDSNGRKSSIFCIANIHFLNYSTQARIFVHLNQLLRSCKEEKRKEMASLVLLSASKQGSSLESQHLLTALSQYVVNFCELQHSHIVKIYQWIVSRPQSGVNPSSKQNPAASCYWSMFPGGGKTHTILRSIQQGRKGLYQRITLDNETVESLLLSLTNRTGASDTKRYIHVQIGQFARVKDDILLFRLLYLGVLHDSQMVYFFGSQQNDHFLLELAGRSINNVSESPYVSMAVIPRLPQQEVPKPNSPNFFLEFVEYQFYSEQNQLRFSFIPDKKLKAVCQFLVNHFDENSFGSGTRTFQNSRLQCVNVLSHVLKEYTSTREEFVSFTCIKSFISVMYDFINRPMVMSNMRRMDLEWLIHSAAEFACQYVHNQEFSSDTYTKRLQSITKWRDLLPQRRCTVFDPTSQSVDFIAYSQDALVTRSGSRMDATSGRIRVHAPYPKASHKIAQPLLRHIFDLPASSFPVSNSTFALTDGHLIMILMLTYRLKHNLPCILIAETGNGKSETIRYIASVLEVEMHRISIHGGHHPEEISEWLRPLVERAKQSPDKPLFVFIDQLNSGTCMSFLKDVICDRMLNNEPLPGNMKIIAAASPHRVMHIHSLSNTEGLAHRRLQHSQALDIHLNHDMVYQVQQMPEALVQHVLDFGKLTEDTEKLYIQSIILSELSYSPNDRDCVEFAKSFAEVIESAQIFSRWTYGDESGASLRDVKRCVKLYRWFLDRLCERASVDSEKFDMKTKDTHNLMRDSAILAIAHCYYYRLSQENRRTFQNRIDILLNKHTTFSRGDFLSTILQEQNHYASMMTIPNGISLNNALRENIFVIIVSMLNFIPCFIIGKSGSSKSLAMEVVKSNLSRRGTSKEKRMLNSLPSIELFVYSCSRLSTPEGLVQTFDAARRFRSSSMDSDTITVVLLNEVGLLEQSTAFPLKVLYRELNDADSGIAIVGLSNFQFDPSVANRTIVVNRTPPDEKDLSKVARGIVDSRHLDNNLGLLAKGYQTVYKNQNDWGIREDFFGLRDLYALVKFINTRLKDQLDAPLLSAAVHRNFGGVPRCLNDILKSFFSAVGMSEDAIHSPPYTSVLDKIKDNITDTSARNLMLLSENNASLHHLFDQKLLNLKDTEVIFGNPSANDMSDDTHIVMTIQKIKICMAEGRTVVLVNCEDLYNSLYDLFNMQYTEYNGKRFVSLALGTYSKLCLVHQNFRAIVIVEKKHANSSLAIALLNRFEKQSFDDSDLIVSEIAKQLVSRLESWVSHFKKGCEIKSDSRDGSGAVKTQAFAGIHCNIINSLVVHLLLRHPSEDMPTLFKRGVDKLLWIATADGIVRSKKRLGPNYFDKYFKEQEHVSLKSLLDFLDTRDYHAINIMTYSPASVDVSFVLSQTGCTENTTFAYLHKIDSEVHLQSLLQKFFESSFRNIVFQCDLSIVTQQKIQHVKLLGERFRQMSPHDRHLRHKTLIFLIHIHPFQQTRFCVHFSGSEKNVFLDEIQTTNPPFTGLLIDPLLSYVERINIRSIILSSFRTSLSQLHFSSPSLNIPKKIQVLSDLLQRDEFWTLLQPKIKQVISQCFSRKNPTYWAEYVAIRVGTFFEAGNYCQSLVYHITQMIVFSFSYVLAQTDVDSNLGVLFNLLRSSSKESAIGVIIWSECWKSLSLPPHHSLALANVDFNTWPVNLMKVNSNGIEAQFPFSFIFCKTLHDLRAVCEHSRTSLSEVLKTYIEFALPLLKDLPQGLSLSYLHDYVGMYGYDTMQVRRTDQLTIIQYLLRATKPDFSGVADIQAFLWNQEPRLHTFFAALECIPGTAQHFIQKLSKPLFLASPQQCDHFLLETLLEATYPPQKIAVSELFEFSEDEWVSRVSAVTSPMLHLLSLIQNSKTRAACETRFRRYLVHKLFVKELDNKLDAHEFWNMIKNQDPRSASCCILIIRWAIDKFKHPLIKPLVKQCLGRFLEFYLREMCHDENVIPLLLDLYVTNSRHGMTPLSNFPSSHLMIALFRNLIVRGQISALISAINVFSPQQFSFREFVQRLSQGTAQEKYPPLNILFVEAYKSLFLSWEISQYTKKLQEEIRSPQFKTLIDQTGTLEDFAKPLGMVETFISRVEELLFRHSTSEEPFCNVTIEERLFLESAINLGESVGRNVLKGLLCQEILHKHGHAAVVEVMASSYARGQLGWLFMKELEPLRDVIAPYRLLLQEHTKSEKRESRAFLKSFVNLKSSYPNTAKLNGKAQDLLSAFERIDFYFKAKSIRKDNVVSLMAHVCSMSISSCRDDPLFAILLWDPDRISKIYIPGQEGASERLKIEGNYCKGFTLKENDPVQQDPFHRVRKLSPITSRIISLWTYSLIMVGMILSENPLKDIHYIVKGIFSNWDALVKIFGGDEEKACATAFSICSNFSPIDPDKLGRKPFASHTPCEHWETHIDEYIQDEQMREIINRDVQRTSLSEGHPKHQQLAHIMQNTTSVSLKVPPQGRASFDSFKYKLLYSTDSRSPDSYPILRYFALNHLRLEATKYIPSVQKWIDRLHKSLNRKIEKSYTKDHTIKDFIDNFDQSEQEELRKFYKEFEYAHNTISSKEISENSLLQECFECQTQLMTDLVGIHNELIHISDNRKTKKQYSIQKYRISSRFASKYHLVIFDVENEIIPALNLYSHNDTIEEYFCEKYVDGKPLIDLSVPEFVFLEHSSENKHRLQLGSLLGKLIPQIPLSKTAFNRVMEDFEDTEAKFHLHRVLQEIEQTILIVEAIARSTSQSHAGDTKIGHFARNFLLLDDENSELLKYPSICELPMQNLINLFDSLHLVKNS